MRVLKCSIVLATMTMLFSGQASAVVISTYTFGNANPSSVDANVSTTSLTAAGFPGFSTFNINSGIMSGSPSGNPNGRFQDTSGDGASADGAGTLSFSITPTAGFQIDFDSISHYATDLLDFNTGVDITYQVGAAASVALGNQGISFNSPAVRSKNLGAIASLQGVTDPVVFVLNVNNTDSNPNLRLAIDDITVNATVSEISSAVPEPTTAALGLMGFAGLVMRRRRAA